MVSEMRFSRKQVIALLFFSAFAKLIFAQSPGGVTGSAIWLKADAGTNTTTNGAVVSSWTDQSGNGRSASQATAGIQPLYATSSINYNPALTFDGTNDRMTLAALTGLPTGAAQMADIVRDDYSVLNPKH